jgi:transposase
MDMARNMGHAIKTCFSNSSIVIDRFHVVRLIMDAMQHVRITLRWEAIEQENIAIKQAKDKGEKYNPEILSNDDTLKELLARSRYLLCKFEKDWTENQARRASLLFEKYPTLHKAYKLTLQFRNIYETKKLEDATNQLDKWKENVIASEIKEFNTVMNSLDYHSKNILNFFNDRSTNAYAESFNSKIKNFRANLRGVTDVKFFLFRLEKLFA